MLGCPVATPVPRPFGAADLADDDAVGAHAEGVADQLAQRHLAPALDVRGAGLEPDDMGSGKAQLGDVLDRDHPLPHWDGGGQDVEQGRLAGWVALAVTMFSPATTDASRNLAHWPLVVPSRASSASEWARHGQTMSESHSSFSVVHDRLDRADY
jgi:hypothetical protein